ncbi:MAG: hypothetical protein A2Y10_17415 [Planctomycetes bacterium GWF2_41_51]|nr:MAG: hypothetical protein A2Y10_17415 [Planctomycetes bacterium GWF2_41_51]HBG28006.1 hypothetical protein [Phycisphaerales bacterium]
MKKLLIVAIMFCFVFENNVFATLHLYDNFANPTESETNWTQYEGPGTGHVAFENGQALLDMSEIGSNWLSQAKMSANNLIPRFNSANEALRFTWDMQLLDPLNDTSNDQYNGFFIGTAARNIIAGQLGDGVSAYGNKRLFFMTGMPSDGVDRGLNKYHYDLTMQGIGLNATDPTLVNLTLTFKIYSYNSAYDANPEGYSDETPVFSHTRPSALHYNTDLGIKFYKFHPVNSTRDSAQCGAMTVDNFYSSIPEPCTMLFLAIGAAALIKKKG